MAAIMSNSANWNDCFSIFVIRVAQLKMNLLEIFIPVHFVLASKILRALLLGSQVHQDE